MLVKLSKYLELFHSFTINTRELIVLFFLINFIEVALQYYISFFCTTK